MSEEVKTNLLSAEHWMRFIFMVVFFLLLEVAGMVIGAVVVLQFLFSLFTGSDNQKLRDFGRSLSTYIHQSLKFLTYNSEEKPFPFSDWPS